MPARAYAERLLKLQIELTKLQAWTIATGRRAIVLFEGRDAAGKGGAIKRFAEHLNPRHARIVSLDKPSEAPPILRTHVRSSQQLNRPSNRLRNPRRVRARARWENSRGLRNPSADGPRPAAESGARPGRPSSKREAASTWRRVAAPRKPRVGGLTAPLIGRIRPATYSVAGRTTKNRRRPTLPGGCPPSTIGAEGLNCSVRNGKRCLPLAKATGKEREAESALLGRETSHGPSKLHSKQRGTTACCEEKKNPSSPRPISTGLLQTSPPFQIRPINLVVYQGSYSLKGMGELISRTASRLDAFSGYPFRA